ncbi:cation diffusion facilitator family transporter [Thermoclostridium stercorarium]|jgi:cation diffusion facilitator family transporter|uniref:Cation diffusion facilitator family transporter n=1 Tax=Thermoclostridium stercorarium subsp. leptospartum DSM 9219 TaxID=1346611 RepID=A0A1B1YL51_THEST|nr:cation diffusion facilitator family transporter [Thermoclostridium stercorarium]ANX01491.1 cation diffusion facilitator family transporter [Thermoclostridium stercorarium subsp. leptospartum DSM 9219]UZQ84601.1 cation diffusion facilitator family transporter [Thermoclostridium stercorarium]
MDGKIPEKGFLCFITRLFIKNHDGVTNRNVRKQYGTLAGMAGIAVNLLLFIFKFIAGILSGSIAVVSDAFNNLSDAASSVISFISFKISSKPADREHPFGHARIEYISSSLVAVIILFIGIELLKNSIGKIINPGTVVLSTLTVIILGLSIVLKLWLYFLNKRIGKYINSYLMHATAADNLSDVFATSAVLVSVATEQFTGIGIDGYMGVIVSGVIMLSGIKILKEMMDSIIGRAPSKEIISLIENYILKYDGVLGIHDLVVHDYGPLHCFASAHVEVDANEDLLKSHDLIDHIERDISIDHGIHLVIHLDPIVTDDPYVNELREKTERIVKEIDASLSVHDFRIIKGSTHNNLIFDVLMPYYCKLSEKEIEERIIEKISEIDKTLFVVVTIDKSFVSTPNQKAVK